MTDVTNVLYVGDRAIRTDSIPTLLKQYELLPKFLEELAIDEAIAEVSCTTEEKQKALLEICQKHQLTNLEEQQKWMDERGLNASEVETMATRSLRIQKFKEETWGRKVRRHFMERKPGLDTVVYSLIRTQDAGLAHELYYRILEGEITFEQCAVQYSKGPEVRTGGRLGPVPLNRPHPVISKLLSVSQPGQLWPPRTISDWHIIIRLEDIKSAQLDEPTRKALIDELYNAWLKERVQALTAQVVNPDQQAESAAIAAAENAENAEDPDAAAEPSSERSESTDDDRDDDPPADVAIDASGDQPSDPGSIAPQSDQSDNPEDHDGEPELIVMDAPEVEDVVAEPPPDQPEEQPEVQPDHPTDSPPEASPDRPPNESKLDPASRNTPNSPNPPANPNAPQSLVSTSA